MNKDPLRFYSTKLLEDEYGNVRFAASSANSGSSDNIIYCQLVESIEEWYSNQIIIKTKLFEYKKNYENKEMNEKTRKAILELKKERDNHQSEINIIMNGLLRYASNFEKLNYKEYNQCSLISKYNINKKNWELSKK